MTGLAANFFVYAAEAVEIFVLALLTGKGADRVR